uniref:Fimbrial protein n=1 Tax=Shewanella sp. (strain MR-7) TaxID=60481 RepID=Q0HR84_SHESR
MFEYFFKVVSAILLYIYASESFGFECITDGNRLVGVTTHTIPVDVVLSKDKNEVLIYDLKTNTNCKGDQNFFDALRITTATIHSKLSIKGYVGFLTYDDSIKLDFPSTRMCIWPNSGCTLSFTSNTLIPLKLKVSIRSPGGKLDSAVNLRRGDIIASFTAEQRSGNSWNIDPKTWRFSLKNDLVIPANTCSLTNVTQKVTLPKISNTDLFSNGIGRYNASRTQFKLNLSCEPGTAVDVMFEGKRLAVTETSVLHAAENVGIQIMRAGAEVDLGKFYQVVDNAASSESLTYEAYYYYAGGKVSAADINSTATVTLRYN